MKGRSRSATGRRGAGTAVALALALAAFAPAPAEADFPVCSPGSGPGQCNDPRGVASDFENGHLYVADRGNERIDVFEANGTPLAAIGAGTTNLSSIAVDNSAGASHHDIYAATGAKVRKLDPAGSVLISEFGSFEEIQGIGVTGTGVVYVADSTVTNEFACGGIGEFTKRVQKFSEAGALIETVILPLDPCGDLESFATDPAGNIYVANEGPTQALRKYSPSGTLLWEKEKGLGARALGVDASGNLLAVNLDFQEGGGGSFRVITRYAPSGAYLRRFGHGSIEFNAVGLAANGTSACLSELTSLAVKCVSEPPPGPLAAASTVQATAIGNAQATLKAQINPEGKATTYEFQYVTQQGYEEQGNSFTGLKTKTTTAKAITIPPGTPEEEEEERFKLHLASDLAGCPTATKQLIEEEKCLIPETTYRFQVKASNADGTGNTPIEGSPPTFTTKKALEIEELFATEVGTDSARLSAKVNPLGIPASGHFEYVDQQGYEEQGNSLTGPNTTRVPASGEIDFGAGETGALRSVSVSLAPGTLYHYRLKATDPLIEPTEFTSEERTLTTFSPEAIRPCAANEAFRSGPSALLPDCRAYEMVSPLDKENGDIIALPDGSDGLPASFNQASSDGDKIVYGSSRAFGDAISAPFTSQYLASRGEGGWSSVGISPPLGKGILTVGARLENELKFLSPDLCQSWWETFAEPTLAPAAIPTYTNLYRHLDAGCGGPGWEALTTATPPHKPLPMELQGVSGEGTKAIYTAQDNLTPEAPNLGGGANAFALYYQEAGEGAPHYVCILPSGVPIGGECSGGFIPGFKVTGRGEGLQGALSADGSRVFWTANSGEGKIYERENPGEAQSAISGGVCTEADKACTIEVSKAAEEAAGTSKSQFIAAAANGSRAIFTTSLIGSSELYEFEVATKTTKLIAHKAKAIKVSKDASDVYLSSTEVLAGANPQGKSPLAGEANLYRYHEGTFAFVGTVEGGDLLNATLSPDGLHLAFASKAALSGYDNKDAKGGEADREVYLYDAAANGGAGKLLCASCNPSGARPAGKGGVAAKLPRPGYSLHTIHVLSDEGARLYFEANDSLAPRDTNGVADVYQWEAPGSGDCSEGAFDFSAQNGGCVDLISSGQSAKASEITETSPSGDDVFFATLSSLLTQDYGLIDIYDARAGGGLPPPAPPATECEGESCQHPAPAPAYSAPSSGSYEGPGDLSEEAKPKCPKGKVRKNGKCVKKHKHKAKQRHAGRAGR